MTDSEQADAGRAAARRDQETKTPLDLERSYDAASYLRSTHPYARGYCQELEMHWRDRHRRKEPTR
jgi:hypothetical protein